MPSVGALIWISVRPLVKLVIPTSCGFLLTRTGHMPVSAVKVIAYYQLNVSLPALLFSKVLTAISTDNISSLGSIAIAAIFYMVTGGLLGLLVLALFPSPRNFRYGILVSCIFSNWGDLPTAVVQSVTANPPFSAGDSDLSVAFVAFFIVIWFIALFPLQGHQLIRLDYTRDFDADVARAKSLFTRVVPVRRSAHKARTSELDLPTLISPRPTLTTAESDMDKLADPDKITRLDSKDPTAPLARRLTNSELEQLAVGPSIESPTAARVIPRALPVAVVSAPTSRQARFASGAWQTTKAFFSPPTIALLSALVLALIAPTKALFVKTGYPIPSAPDGNPPLSILLETATFMGNASVPIGLLILGSSLARMTIPRPYRLLPLRSILAVAVSKLAILPILGVVLVELGLVKHGVIAKDDNVLRFTSVYFSCVPAATFQVALTQLYAPDGVESNASTLCAYLCLQYVFLVITGTITTAFELSRLFPSV